MSYGDPQELTDLVREVLKDKKQLKPETSESSPDDPNNQTDDIKKRSKI